MNKTSNSNIIFYILGIIPIIWIALLIAPYTNNNLYGIIKYFPSIINNPLKFNIVENSLKTVLIFLSIYLVIIAMYESNKKNYRRGEEHGSATWGNVKSLNKKYKQKPNNENKILTQNVAIGLNSRKHRRNLNVLLCGGSGAR